MDEEDPSHDDLHGGVGDAGAQQLGRHPPLRQPEVTDLSTRGKYMGHYGYKVVTEGVHELA